MTRKAPNWHIDLNATSSGLGLRHTTGQALLSPESGTRKRKTNSTANHVASQESSMACRRDLVLQVSGQRAELDQIMHSMGLQVIGLQECRAKKARILEGENFYVISKPADAKGRRGCELWVAKELRPDNQNARLLHSEPELLLASLGLPKCRCFVLVFHAPPECAGEPERLSWWQHCRSVVQESAVDMEVLVTLCDTNARVGSVQSSWVGPMSPGPDGLEHFFLAGWTSSAAARARNDHVAIPTQRPRAPEIPRWVGIDTHAEHLAKRLRIKSAEYFPVPYAGLENRGLPNEFLPSLRGSNHALNGELQRTLLRDCWAVRCSRRGEMRMTTDGNCLVSCRRLRVVQLRHNVDCLSLRIRKMVKEGFASYTSDLSVEAQRAAARSDQSTLFAVVKRLKFKSSQSVPSFLLEDGKPATLQSGRAEQVAETSCGSVWRLGSYCSVCPELPYGGSGGSVHDGWKNAFCRNGGSGSGGNCWTSE